MYLIIYWADFFFVLPLTFSISLSNGEVGELLDVIDHSTGWGKKRNIWTCSCVYAHIYTRLWDKSLSYTLPDWHLNWRESKLNKSNNYAKKRMFICGMLFLREEKSGKLSNFLGKTRNFYASIDTRDQKVYGEEKWKSVGCQF